MIRFQIFGLRFSLPLLALLMFPLAHYLGMRGSVGGIALCLCAHELGHIAAARIIGVEIQEIRILPFGGSAHMENPYRLSAARLLAVAAAGPAANLVLIICTAALAQWSLLSPARAAGIVRTSAVLMLFNLLPALPLDGGRMLYALTQSSIGQERALRLGLLLGRVLALAMLCGAVLLRLRSRKWNLSFILAALFILSSERDERQALLHSHAQRLSAVLQGTNQPLPVRIYQMDGQTPASAALRLMRPKESAWFVLTEKGEAKSLLDGASLLRQLLRADAEQPIASLGRYFIVQKKDCCK